MPIARRGIEDDDRQAWSLRAHETGLGSKNVAVPSIPISRKLSVREVLDGCQTPI